MTGLVGLELGFLFTVAIDGLAVVGGLIGGCLMDMDGFDGVGGFSPVALDSSFILTKKICFTSLLRFTVATYYSYS